MLPVSPQLQYGPTHLVHQFRESEHLSLVFWFLAAVPPDPCTVTPGQPPCITLGFSHVFLGLAQEHVCHLSLCHLTYLLASSPQALVSQTEKGHGHGDGMC